MGVHSEGCGEFASEPAAARGASPQRGIPAHRRLHQPRLPLSEVVLLRRFPQSSPGTLRAVPSVGTGQNAQDLHRGRADVGVPCASAPAHVRPPLGLGAVAFPNPCHGT